MIPPLFYGTAWKKERTSELVMQALKSGFRAIDTACQPKHYEEPLVGLALAKLYEQKVLTREELFLQTKFTPISGQDPQRVPYDPTSPLESQIEYSLGVSLANLHTEYLDSWVLHSPIMPYSQTLKAWHTMEQGVANGKVRYLGMSNCYELELLTRLYGDATIKPKFLQNRFYAATDYDKAIRAWCDVHGVIYQSFWSLSANPHLLAHPSIVELSRYFGKTDAQIWYRFLTQQGIIPLIGTTSQVHMREDLSIFDFELSRDMCKQIEAILE